MTGAREILGEKKRARREPLQRKKIREKTGEDLGKIWGRFGEDPDNIRKEKSEEDHKQDWQEKIRRKKI